jgi:hypothetical protein
MLATKIDAARPPAEVAAARRPRSKTLATWLAVAAGTFGAHRFYLHGWADRWGWAHPLPTLAGLAGVLRMRLLGQDDVVGWVLAPLLGLAVAVAMLEAIVIGLTSDERWAERFGQPARATGWGPVIGVVVALLLGGTALLSAIAFSGQKFFEVTAPSGGG